MPRFPQPSSDKADVASRRGRIQAFDTMKMKTFAALALCCVVGSLTPPAEAGELEFNQTIADCENKWFGAETGAGEVILGYVYVDPSAGFTFEHYGTLEEIGGGLRAVQSEIAREARVIQRIGHNFPAICLSQAQVAELGLPATPETMKFYKDDRPPAEHHAAWAYHYNHIGASDKALVHVSKAIAAGAASTDLTFEHAFALNVLGRFDETITLLEPDLASGDMTGDLIAELAYARMMKGETLRAIELYTQAIDHDEGNPSTRRWEFAQNIAAAYERLGDTGQRDIWIKRSEEYRGAEK